MPKHPFVYIVASRKNGTIYIGVTSVLPARVWHHKKGTYEGFSQRHKCSLLVWFEAHGSMEAAIVREKQLKRWKRSWKLRLIEEMNPDWVDLFDQVCG